MSTIQIIGIILISIYYGIWGLFWLFCTLCHTTAIATKYSTLRISANGLLGSVAAGCASFFALYGSLNRIYEAHITPIVLMFIAHVAEMIVAFRMSAYSMEKLNAIHHYDKEEKTHDTDLQ